MMLQKLARLNFGSSQRSEIVDSSRVVEQKVGFASVRFSWLRRMKPHSVDRGNSYQADALATVAGTRTSIQV
jgi:hypothetical protein